MAKRFVHLVGRPMSLWNWFALSRSLSLSLSLCCCCFVMSPPPPPPFFLFFIALVPLLVIRLLLLLRLLILIRILRLLRPPVGRCPPTTRLYLFLSAYGSCTTVVAPWTK